MARIIYQLGLGSGARGPNDWIGARVGAYEYICTIEDHTAPITSSFDLEESGWQRAWSDKVIGGTFTVWRREIKD